MVFSRTTYPSPISDIERDIAFFLPGPVLRIHYIQRFACRLKKQRFWSGDVDVPFDSPGRFYCRSIECKSIIGRKRYFSLHFPAGWNLVREEDANLDFMHKQGILCYLLSWLAKAHGERDVLRTLAGSCSTIPSDKGITIYDTRAYLTLARSKNSYVPRSLSAK